MPKEMFLARFELVVARFGPPKIQKGLENGLFWDKKWVKNVPRNKKRRAWYKERHDEWDVWDKERRELIENRDALQKGLRTAVESAVKGKEFFQK